MNIEEGNPKKGVIRLSDDRKYAQMDFVEEDVDTSAMAREYGVPTPTQLDMINKLARVPLTKEQVFVFSAKLAGDMIIPNRYIQLHRSALDTFKNDAKSGVALMLDHSWANFFGGGLALVYGRTFDAQLKKSDADNETWALFADHYLVRGKEKDSISTDSLIADLSDGTAFDTSIGWGAKTYECSICSNDIRKMSECEHFPGQTYDGELCYAIAKPPSFLMENSIVFDGAYPGAGILSQSSILDQGEKMVPVDNIKGLDAEATLFHVYSATKGKLLTFARKEDVETKAMYRVASLLDKASTKGGGKVDLNTLIDKESTGDNAGDVTNIYMTRDEAEAEFGREIEPEEVLMYAVEGEKYMKELIAEAEAWGIRAKGEHYNKESWNQHYECMDADGLKRIIDTFKQEAEVNIPEGRQTDPEATSQFDQDGTQIPDEAFMM